MKLKKQTVRALAFIAMAIIGAAFLTAEIRANERRTIPITQAHETASAAADTITAQRDLGSPSNEIFLSYFSRLIRFAAFGR